jgi:hypothetical protein
MAQVFDGKLIILEGLGFVITDQLILTTTENLVN